MAGLGEDQLRTGRRYKVTNYGDSYHFEIVRIGTSDIHCKDLNSLEKFNYSEIIKYGRGQDFEIVETRNL